MSSNNFMKELDNQLKNKTNGQVTLNNSKWKIASGCLSSLPNLLLIAFVILKLCNVIAWSWVWVLAPLWIPFALIIALLLIMLIGVVIYALIKK